EELEKTIVRDRDAGFLPSCVIGNAGTVNTGAVDPMDKLADIASRNSMWFHVDAAYGGPAAATSLARKLFVGMDRADSVATDAHKWLYAPFETGIAFVSNKELLRKAFSVIPDYLRETNGADRYDATEYHFQLSRNFKALKLWMAFKAYGSKLLREAIEENIRSMTHFAGLVDASPEFERLAPVPLSVVCFRYRTEDRMHWSDEAYLSLLNRKILADAEKDGRVFISGTLISGKRALRACSVNHRTTYRHVEHLLDVIREIGNRVHISLIADYARMNHKTN
ncbi:MAG TPA: pyridoxal-dependent decarboxylase, partial [Bacteroidota bacterium]